MCNECSPIRSIPLPDGQPASLLVPLEPDWRSPYADDQPPEQQPVPDREIASQAADARLATTLRATNLAAALDRLRRTL